MQSSRAHEVSVSLQQEADVADVLVSTTELIEDLRAGRMVILVDDEGRENEGDLFIAAEMATPQAINFMVTYGRGLVCLTLDQARADRLQLPMMTANNETPLQTAFTVSIEARTGITTGISAFDRAHTIATAINPSWGSEAISSPGHMFPLVAREGGVFERAGHTEASVDLARLAGMQPSGVICEILKEDGSMARLPELVAFARKHSLSVGSIADLISYRRSIETTDPITTDANA
ncbi:3,4-dihydroxy-2-butanone-4-phosphate synthase [Agrobacterium larrymoorei]|uniref:3,4-dihydroxy-2-butanone 4-phosphate synthase n=1 Tax=Agrobacterium larrymoorei TaxID=160699 RepID=A0A4D7E0R8_9HYPH|nr:3,4-dihydroxy-2-butanone-4-phosphate synthase [Agrobacterium larrymoorei]QYA10112.1 3,4-dihydroxy-2-butanone-4-phosphate synthase [Agrobacterium larrymoorei]